jgi:hypothetical protein
VDFRRLDVFGSGMAKRKKDGELSSGGDWELDKAHPMLADALLTYEEFDFSGRVKAGVHSVRGEGPTVRCSNSLCRNGGYDMRPEIEAMMFPKRRRSKSVHLQCDGCETDPKPKRSVQNGCTGSIEGTLKLTMRTL